MADVTHVGIIGLGTMGGSMRQRMRTKGLTVTGYGPNSAVTDVAELSDHVNALPTPRIIWKLVSSGIAAIFARFVSHQEDSPSMTAVATLRNQVGGHSVRKS